MSAFLTGGQTAGGANLDTSERRRKERRNGGAESNERKGNERKGKERTGQDRTGQDRPKGQIITAMRQQERGDKTADIWGETVDQLGNVLPMEEAVRGMGIQELRGRSQFREVDSRLERVAPAVNTTGQLCFIQPGVPVENGLIESFGERLRDECLNL